MVLKRLKSLIKNPWRLFIFLRDHRLTDWIPDKLYLKLYFKAKTGKKLNLKNPKTFNEKLQWLKIYNRNDIYTIMVDKFEVKNWISEKIGSQYVIPTIGVWENFDDIDFKMLPNQFVLKCTHDSGGLIICKDKSKLDIGAARKLINKSLKRNYYFLSREWPYKNVKPRIICEEYVEDNGEALTDYKFFCFNGEPKFMYLSKDKADDPKTDFFDMEYNHLDMIMRDPNSDIPPPKPESFEQMKELARILSQGVPHLRVDFYFPNGKIYVGEMTFFHCGGCVPIKPDHWNDTLGEWININDL